MSKFSLYEQNYDASKAYVVALLVNPKTGVIQLATTGYVKKTPLRSAPASARRLVPNLDECVLVTWMAASSESGRSTLLTMLARRRLGFLALTRTTASSALAKEQARCCTARSLR